MKRIYTFEAIKFGFVTFFKNPLFFLFAFIVSMLLWFVGLLISFFIAMPFLAHFFRFAKKIYVQVLEIIPELNVKAIFTEGVHQAVAGGVQSGKGGAVGFFGGLVSGIKNGGPFGVIRQGIRGVTNGIHNVIIEKLDELKDIWREILTHKILFVYFIVGLFLFLFFAKVVYDFIMIGWVRLSLRFYDTGKGSIKMLFSRLSVMITYILATLLFFCIAFVPTIIFFWLYLFLSLFIKTSCSAVLFGYVCAFVCSWYFMLRLWFYPYFIIDARVGVIESLKMSYNLGIGFLSVAVSLIGFGLILGVPLWISFLFPHALTFIILGIILLIVWISSWVSYAFLYRRLSVKK